MSTPLVSVCMPAYNAERYVASAIDSVLAQTYTNLELVVVNDGSTDNTAGVLRPYGSHPNVRVITQANRGQCAAANEAFRQSKGDYIKFFDADDLLSPRFIENQVKRLAGRTDTVASAAWGRFSDDDLQTFRLVEETVYRDLRPMDWLLESMAEGPNMMQCALWLIPRPVLQASGLWDERLSLINDFDFFIRVLLHSREVLFTPDAVLYYRSGVGGSLSGTKSRKAMESAFLSTKLGVETILRFEDSPRTRRICADSFQVWKYQFFPHFPDLYQAAEQQVQKLGGSSYRFPAGGFTRQLAQVVGWKGAKRFKQLMGKV